MRWADIPPASLFGEAAAIFSWYLSEMLQDSTVCLETGLNAGESVSKMGRLQPSVTKTGAPFADEPVSRILSRTAIPLGPALLQGSSNLPGGFRLAAALAVAKGPRWRTGQARIAANLGRTAIPSLFGLAPCGVYPASAVTAGAVRSYRTFSPLPAARESSGRYLLCGTGRPEAFTPRSRTLSGTLPCGVRTFLCRFYPTAAAQPACVFHYRR
jgi:hypothetical protein